jgi:hypothetical protein
VAVLWNDGQGRFDAAAVQRLEPGARMFATLRDRASGPPSLVYVTRDAVKRVRFSAGRAPGEAEPLLPPGLSLSGGTGVAAADLDGDGLDDLAVVDAQGLRILRGIEAQP